MTNARHSMESPEWYTPAPFVRAARAVLGRIELDPASCAEANEIVKADRFFTEQDNGLAQAWEGTIFLNPPGGLVPQFWDALVLESTKPWFKAAIWIGYSLEQLQTLQVRPAVVQPFRTPLDYPLCYPSRRIAFVENEAKKEQRIAKLLAKGKNANVKSSPSHANYIAYLGPNKDKFRYEFRGFGHVVTPK